MLTRIVLLCFQYLVTGAQWLLSANRFCHRGSLISFQRVHMIRQSFRVYDHNRSVVYLHGLWLSDGCRMQEPTNQRGESDKTTKYETLPTFLTGSKRSWADHSSEHYVYSMQILPTSTFWCVRELHPCICGILPRRTMWERKAPVDSGRAETSRGVLMRALVQQSLLLPNHFTISPIFQSLNTNEKIER